MAGLECPFFRSTIFASCPVIVQHHARDLCRPRTTVVFPTAWSMIESYLWATREREEGADDSDMRAWEKTIKNKSVHPDHQLEY